MDKKTTDVSVIVPIYRTPTKLLERCLGSLASQTLKNLEVVLVFDEPADGYRKIIEDYQARMGIQVLEQAHQGVSAARNLGVAHAKGEWVAFVDSDDWIDEQMLEYQLQAGRERQADIVMTECVLEYGTVSEGRNYQKEETVFEGDSKRDFECDVLKPQTGAGFVTSKLFRRDLMTVGNMWFRTDLAAAEDAEFMLRAACAAQRIVYLPYAMYHYWINPDSAVRSYRPDYAQRYIRTMEAMARDLDEMGDREYCRDAHGSCVLYHLLLIAVNDTFHPNNGRSGREQRKALRKLVQQPMFTQALRRIHYGDFSMTRKITLVCLKLRWYWGVYLIAKVRHGQFRRRAEK